MQAAVRSQIRRHDDHALLQRDEAYKVEKERLAGAVLADDEPDRRSTFPDAVDVLDQLSDFACAPDLDMLKTQFGNDART